LLEKDLDGGKHKVSLDVQGDLGEIYYLLIISFMIGNFALDGVGI
jgi:hypothetical protein